MKIKSLKEILKHFEEKEYDDWEIGLWDFNNQRELAWTEGSWSFSKADRKMTFPVDVPPVDGETIDNRVKRLMSEIENQTKEWNSKKKQENK